MIRFSCALAFTLIAGPLGAASVEELGWLSGCWQAEGSEPGTLEQWTAPAGGTMLGLSRTVRGGRTVGYEFLRIEERPDIGLALVALPSGQSEATFPLARLGEREVLFENPAHDFPQRIAYRLDEGGRLAARIEGRLDGVDRSIDFPMTRVSCDE